MPHISCGFVFFGLREGREPSTFTRVLPSAPSNSLSSYFSHVNHQHAPNAFFSVFLSFFFLLSMPFIFLWRYDNRPISRLIKGVYVILYYLSSGSVLESRTHYRPVSLLGRLLSQYLMTRGEICMESRTQLRLAKKN